jgi:hypothetical protein
MSPLGLSHALLPVRAAPINSGSPYTGLAIDNDAVCSVALSVSLSWLELVRRETSTHPRRFGGLVQLDADPGRRARTAAGRAAQHAEQFPTGSDART